jgi:polyferredoxin
MRKTRWYDLLWIPMVISWLLPFYNIHFVWLTAVIMAVSVGITLFANSKTYCNNYCGRGQLYQLLGGRLGLSLNRKPPRFLRSRWFRLAFFTLFLVKFGMMMTSTPGSVESAEGLEQAMFMTLAMGLLAMILFKPRSWCVCCPMGTTMQGICRIRNHGSEKRADDLS